MTTHAVICSSNIGRARKAELEDDTNAQQNTVLWIPLSKKDHTWCYSEWYVTFTMDYKLGISTSPAFNKYSTTAEISRQRFQNCAASDCFSDMWIKNPSLFLWRLQKQKMLYALYITFSVSLSKTSLWISQLLYPFQLL